MKPVQLKESSVRDAIDTPKIEIEPFSISANKLRHNYVAHVDKITKQSAILAYLYIYMAGGGHLMFFLQLRKPKKNRRKGTKIQGVTNNNRGQWQPEGKGNLMA